MELASPKQGTHTKGSNKEIEACSAKGVVLQKGHEVARTKKDNNIHILESCPKKRWCMRRIVV